MNAVKQPNFQVLFQTGHQPFKIHPSFIFRHPFLYEKNKMGCLHCKEMEKLNFKVYNPTYLDHLK